MSIPKTIDEKTILYTKPNGYFYHLDAKCARLNSTSQFNNNLQSRVIPYKDVKNYGLLACPVCAIENSEAKLV
jgi:hypothetical protein